MQFEEQRASARFNFEAPVIIENCQTGEFYDGSVYNHSHGGMYVELDNFLRPGSNIRILVERAKNTSLKECCEAKIIWCREITGAVVLYNYGAGVQYDPTAEPLDCRKIFKVIEGGASANKL
jgi:Tfp pilus assembly protein PilZ